MDTLVPFAPRGYQGLERMLQSPLCGSTKVHVNIDLRILKGPFTVPYEPLQVPILAVGMTVKFHIFQFARITLEPPLLACCTDFPRK